MRRVIVHKSISTLHNNTSSPPPILLYLNIFKLKMYFIDKSIKKKIFKITILHYGIDEEIKYLLLNVFRHLINLKIKPSTLTKNL